MEAAATPLHLIRRPCSRATRCAAIGDPLISTEDAKAGLEAALAAAGFDRAKPNARVAWLAFRTFAAEPVDAATDGLLFQCGIDGLTGEPWFQWHLTRQFTHEDDGEYTGMEQLQLSIFYESAPDLTSVETTLWSFDCASSEEWFVRVEGLPEFGIVAHRQPIGCELFQEEV